MLKFRKVLCTTRPCFCKCCTLLSASTPRKLIPMKTYNAFLPMSLTNPSIVTINSSSLIRSNMLRASLASLIFVQRVLFVSATKSGFRNFAVYFHKLRFLHRMFWSFQFFVCWVERIFEICGQGIWIYQGVLEFHYNRLCITILVHFDQRWFFFQNKNLESSTTKSFNNFL